MTHSLPHPENEHQCSVNPGSTIFGNASWNMKRAVLWHSFIIELSAAFLGKYHCCNIHTMSSKWGSTERQRHLTMHHKKSLGRAGTLIHNQTIGHLSMQKCLLQQCYYVLKMIVNRASATFGLASWNMQGLCSDINPYSNYRPPFLAKMFSTTSPLRSENQRQRSVNVVRPCIMEHEGAVRLHWSIIDLPTA